MRNGNVEMDLWYCLDAYCEAQGMLQKAYGAIASDLNNAHWKTELDKVVRVKIAAKRATIETLINLIKERG